MTLDTHSEEYRHQCEVRWCLRQGFAWFERYVKDVADKRGPGAASRLWRDVKEQARRGNTGAPGEWKGEQETIEVPAARGHHQPADAVAAGDAG